jgi:hypothetical protein
VTKDPRTIAADLPAFEALLAGLPWLRHLGKPHPCDPEVTRIHDWDEWHGPEGGYGDWFGRYPAMVRDQIEADYPDRGAELVATWDRIEESVLGLAGPSLPGFGEGDAWHGPTACVYDAAYSAALVGWHVLLGRPLPDPIADRWGWLADGHWPCDHAEPPPGLWDESKIDVAAGKLVVY